MRWRKKYLEVKKMIDLSVLSQVGKLRQMQKQMAKKKLVIEDKGIRVIVNGKQEIEELSFEKGTGADQIKKLINKAFNQLKKEMAKELMGGVSS